MNTIHNRKMQVGAILGAIYCLFSTTGLWAQPFPMSEGLYRLPYATGIELRVSGDVWTHDPLGCLDLIGRRRGGQTAYFIAAMAGGWVRAIQDNNDRECHESLPAPNDFCCWRLNNYIVLEHPNGEWSTYIHLAHNSAANGLRVGDWVDAGEILGTEGSVGCSTGNHTHIEVTRPYPHINQPWGGEGGMLRDRGQLLNPVFCGVPDNIVTRGQDVTCGPCQDVCNPTVIHSGTVIAPATVRRASTQIISTASFAPAASAIYRAGTEVVFSPGFTVLAGSSLSAHIKGCNTQN